MIPWWWLIPAGFAGAFVTFVILTVWASWSIPDLRDLGLDEELKRQ